MPLTYLLYAVWSYRITTKLRRRRRRGRHLVFTTSYLPDNDNRQTAGPPATVACRHWWNSHDATPTRALSDVIGPSMSAICLIHAAHGVTARASTVFRRAGSTSARRAASWMFAILHHSNDQIASSSSQLYERMTSARRALVEPGRRASFIV